MKMSLNFKFLFNYFTPLFFQSSEFGVSINADNSVLNFYINKPESCLENDNYKFCFDRTVQCGGETAVIMLISTALLLDSIIRNSVCTPAKFSSLASLLSPFSSIVMQTPIFLN
jgi:hypothetical protein